MIIILSRGFLYDIRCTSAHAIISLYLYVIVLYFSASHAPERTSQQCDKTEKEPISAR